MRLSIYSICCVSSSLLILFPCFPSSFLNRQHEQGRISVIGSSFGRSVCFFINQIAICWDPSYEYLVVLSQFVALASRVDLDFILELSRARIAAVAVYNKHFVFRFSKYKVGCCSSNSLLCGSLCCSRLV